MAMPVKSTLSQMTVGTVEDSQKYVKKIWCTSRARVYLPHIGHRKCIKIVLKHNFVNKTQNLALLSRTFFGDILCENSQGFSNFPPWVRESQPNFSRILLN
jgi:hypothetical protein